MSRNNGKNQEPPGKSENTEREFGHPTEPWKPVWENVQSNSNIEKILDVPGTEDMAGVLARANFKSESQRIAAVRLAYKNRKFNDSAHQEMLRDYCASTLGKGGLGKILQVQAGTNLLAPDMIRVALGMPKTKEPERVHHASDLRSEGREKEVDDRSR